MESKLKIKVIGISPMEQSFHVKVRAENKMYPQGKADFDVQVDRHVRRNRKREQTIEEITNKALFRVREICRHIAQQ